MTTKAESKAGERTQGFHSGSESLMGRKQFIFWDHDYRPHWVHFGKGNLSVQIEVEEKCGLHIQTTEQAEGKRAGKETWASIPSDAARALRDFLNKNLTDTRRTHETIQEEAARTGRPIGQIQFERSQGRPWTQHTPGPWSTADNGAGILKVFGKHLAVVADVASLRDGMQNDERDAERAANARLIAAAPELLEVCKRASKQYADDIEQIGPCDHSVGICICEIIRDAEMLNAAIAKAEGTSDRK